jgi:hypothetical protein
MAEAAPSYNIMLTIEKHSRGMQENTNTPQQVVGSGITILTGVGALNVESPIQCNIEINDAQVTGLLGYLGLLNAGIDTSAIETAVAILVAAS